LDDHKESRASVVPTSQIPVASTFLVLSVIKIMGLGSIPFA